MKPKTLMAWSGGKDSSLALYELLRGGEHEMTALLTTVTEDYQRISMHGVREALLEAQAESLRLPLKRVLIPKACSDVKYEERMRAALQEAKAEGVTHVAFGDIFLEDLRRYREDKLAEAGLEAVFPLWKRDTRAMAREFITLGFKAILACVDTQVLDARFSGRDYDLDLLMDLPDNVDQCGENGEFHSFVYGGPIFREEIPFIRGESVLRDERFQYTDLAPTKL